MSEENEHISKISGLLSKWKWIYIVYVVLFAAFTRVTYMAEIVNNVPALEKELRAENTRQAILIDHIEEEVEILTHAMLGGFDILKWREIVLYQNDKGETYLYKNGHLIELKYSASIGDYFYWKNKKRKFISE